MSTDREAVVWTRLGGTPRRMGRLYVTDSDCRFTYDSAYVKTGQPGLGLVYATEYYQGKTLSRPRKKPFDLFPPLQSLIPPAQEDNFQRNLALKYLASQGIKDRTGFDADWEILKASGHGGIGHLDLFPSDDKAEQWYSTVPAHRLTEISDELGFTLKEFMTWFDEDIEILIQTVGPTPSVGGAIPKLLLSIPESGWDGRIGLPTRDKTPGVTDVVLKFEQTTRYPGIIELEAMALDMHRQAGFDTPRYWPCQFKGMPALAVERFDRDADNQPLCMETLYSILASGTAISNHYDYRYDLIATAIDQSAVRIATDATAAKDHLFSCLIMSMLTGNGDLHLENLAILTRDGKRAFTPIYDPTPMRAYSQHDMLSVMPFGGYGEYPEGSDEATGFVAAIAQLSKNFGLTTARFVELISGLLAATKDYESRINAFETVPDENRERLIKRISEVRGPLASMLD